MVGCTKGANSIPEAAKSFVVIRTVPTLVPRVTGIKDRGAIHKVDGLGSESKATVIWGAY